MYITVNETESEADMLIPKRYKKRKNIMEVAEDGKVQMPTMVYPQVDGITPTVVMPSEVNTIIENQEEMDRIRTAHLFGTVGGCYTSNSTDNKEK